MSSKTRIAVAERVRPAPNSRSSAACSNTRTLKPRRIQRDRKRETAEAATGDQYGSGVAYRRHRRPALTALPRNLACTSRIRPVDLHHVPKHRPGKLSEALRSVLVVTDVEVMERKSGTQVAEAWSARSDAADEPPDPDDFRGRTAAWTTPHDSRADHGYAWKARTSSPVCRAASGSLWRLACSRWRRVIRRKTG